MSINTVVIGSGPAGLCLSYILHGNIPYYNPHKPHPDPELHRLLAQYEKRPGGKSLLDAVSNRDVLQHVIDKGPHFRSSMLPVNLLLDLLVVSDEINYVSRDQMDSRITWVHEPERAIDHVVIGTHPGGQWAQSDTSTTTPDDQCLSYAEMLSLPGYPFSTHYKEKYGNAPPEFLRPRRKDIASYFDAYPDIVGISDSLIIGTVIEVDIRSKGGYSVSYNGQVGLMTPGSESVPGSPSGPSSQTASWASPKRSPSCRLTTTNVVLATGIFDKPSQFKTHKHANCSSKSLLYNSECTGMTLNELIDKRFNGLFHFDHSDSDVTLVVGSGFSAADIISSTFKQGGRVLHLFKWGDKPCPLKGFPRELYPEYASIYRWMRLAAATQKRSASGAQPTNGVVSTSRKCKFEENGCHYEGLANTKILSAEDGVLKLELPGGEVLTRHVGGVRICVGRTGSLQFLSNRILHALDLAQQEAYTVNKHTISKRILNPRKDKGDPSNGLSDLGHKHTNRPVSNGDPKTPDSAGASPCTYVAAGAPGDAQSCEAMDNAFYGDFQVLPNMYAIGSLAGDSLVRFVLGGAAAVGKLLGV
ncbi:hypothetical protein B0I73DRAFT_127715 [Yarrowia lipolytica]|jgi:hypothetical protein|uniref:YALI0D07106p n=2 Tax=Yarrowia lipolytica TaxID=4952 RepID=Q6C9Z6_YARLI|nr:YALI0D07106p [Yarrowia lipolytica CLIB122]AOW03706.1 hypothetical protein YALI1_D09068g [Yarrowia lipolytica]KAB8284378.1 hypothetical protein BKA91DRAFT_135259 [Yarrowia lipolytica]KAE8172646.1 hypothetical protein BKA90DRAFT_137011 [Yarrowia lipolytica]KAJ8054692.1 hypothetical protein LXG23DRAFT_56247 [Yarrowia lipolytica]QNP97694.1 Hypothetical protein YALI2_D00135g [Yarrowia lipolytica]|eukprot:XP_502516.1 YALI0D07106p [Yarrowia lipolytica CLIB122]